MAALGLQVFRALQEAEWISGLAMYAEFRNAADFNVPDRRHGR